MENFYVYILQVNAGLAVFYLLYRILVVKDTFFEVRRIFLLAALLLAFTYPAVSLAEWLKDKQPLQAVIVDYTEFIVQVVALPSESATEKTVFTVENILLTIWIAGSLVLMFRFLVQLGAIIRLRILGKVQYVFDTRIIVLEKDKAPFSFFGWIFIDPCCYETKELQEILIHEKAHVRQGHSWDMLAGEILCIFFWFNPGAWLIRREIRQNLEFLADRGVLSSGCNRKDYQYHLLRLSNQSAAAQIINNFNVSQLKKRIMMMNKKRASRVGLIKYVVVLPVTGLLILAGNARTVAEVAQEVVGHVVSTEQEMPGTLVPPEDGWKVSGQVTNEKGENISGATVAVSSDGKIVKTVSTNAKGEYFLSVPNGSKELCFSYPGMATQCKTVTKEVSTVNIVMKAGKATVDKDETLKLERIVVMGGVPENQKFERTIYTVVEEMPQFPGGQKEAAQYVAKNIRYPRYAVEQRIQGTVDVDFVIGKDGYLSDIRVVKGVDGALDAEAVRVMYSMPKWIPGKKSGKPVDVRCSMPISFELVQRTEDGNFIPVEATKTKISVRSSGMEMEADRVDVNVSSVTAVVKGDTNVYHVTQKGTNAPNQNVSFTVTSKENRSSSISPMLYQGAISQVNLDDQIVILDGKLVEDVKELPQDLSKVEEILLLRKESAVRKMNKKYNRDANSVLVIKSN